MHILKIQTQAEKWKCADTTTLPLTFVIFSLSFEQIVECFRVRNGFMVSLRTDGNISVKALDNTVNVFGLWCVLG